MAEIAARWPQIVGARTARLCAPLKLTGRGDTATLHIAARGPAAVLIEAESRRIVERVNTYCGVTVAHRLSIVRESARRAEADAPPRQGLKPSERLKLERGLAQVEHPGLKAALLRMGAGAASRAKTT